MFRISCLFISLFAAYSITATAQSAAADSVRAVIDKAMPHSFKNWDVTVDSLPAGGKKVYAPSMVNYHLVFKMQHSAYEIRKRDALYAVNNFLNFTEMAGYRKIIASTKVEIMVSTNVGVDISTYPCSFPLSYCSRITPVEVGLPTTPALALMGLQPADCPIAKAQNLTAFDMDFQYNDEAVIFIGKGLGDKVTKVNKAGYSVDRYSVQSELEFGKPVSNILVDIKGNVDDINTIIKMIDWQALNNLGN